MKPLKIYFISEIIKNNTSYQIPEEHIKILDECLAKHQANPNSGKSWDEVKAGLQTKNNEL